MTNMKKIIALLLAVLMIATVFAGCANEPAGNDTTAGNAANDDTTAGSANDDTTAGNTEPVKLTFMHSNAEWEEDSLGGKWEAIVEEKCNVEIEWYLPPTTAYEENLQLVMMDDDKPDAMIIPEGWLTQASFKTACQDGIFTDLKPYIEKYDNIMAHTRQESWDALDVNQTGNIWGIPRSTMIRIEGVSYITEWVEALGGDDFYKEGETITKDEFLDHLIAFTKDDPDGDGIDNTYGIKTSAQSGRLDGYGNVIHHCGAGWIEDGEGSYFNPRFSKTCTWYRDALEYTKKQYEAGVFDPDVFTIDGTIAEERYATMTYGCQGTFPGWLQVEPTEAKPFTQTYVPEIVTEEGADYWSSNFSTGIWWFWAVPSDCENVDAVLTVFDYLLSDEGWAMAVANGVEGYNYEYDEATGEYDYTKQEALAAEDPEWNAGNPIKSIVRRSSGADFFVDRKYDAETREKLEKFILQAVENGTVSLDRGYKPEIGNDSVYIEYLNNMYVEENKIITGEKPLEYWDEILDGWFAAGGEEYTKDMIAYITEQEAIKDYASSIDRD